MTPPTSRVDMAQMNAAIDRILALPATTQAEMKEKRRARRKARNPLSVKTRTNSAHPAAR